MNVAGYFERLAADDVVAAATPDAAMVPALRRAWREIKSIRRGEPTQFRLRLWRMAKTDGAANPVLVSGFMPDDPTPYAMHLVPWERWLAMEVDLALETARLPPLAVAGRLLAEMTLSGFSRAEIAARRERLRKAAASALAQ